MLHRQVVKSFENREQDEGVGARVRRSIGTMEVGLNRNSFIIIIPIIK